MVAEVQADVGVESRMSIQAASWQTMVPAASYGITGEDSSCLQRGEAGCNEGDGRPYEDVKADTIRSGLAGSREDPLVHEQDRDFGWPGHCLVEDLCEVPPEQCRRELVVRKIMTVHAVTVANTNDHGHGQRDRGCLQSRSQHCVFTTQIDGIVPARQGSTGHRNPAVDALHGLQCVRRRRRRW